MLLNLQRIMKSVHRTTLQPDPVSNTDKQNHSVVKVNGLMELLTDTRRGAIREMDILYQYVPFVHTMAPLSSVHCDVIPP